MSISSIQGLTGYDYSSDLYTSRSKQKTISTSNRNTGPDTVSLSEEVLSMMKKKEASSSQGEESEQQLETIDIEARKKASQKTSKKTSFNMFSFLLESLFLAELNSNADGTTQAEGDDGASETSVQSKELPAQTKTFQKSTNALQDKSGVAEIKKTLANLGKGKATIQDILTATANAGKSEKANGSTSIASSKNSDADKTSASYSL